MQVEIATYDEIKKMFEELKSLIQNNKQVEQKKMYTTKDIMEDFKVSRSTVEYWRTSKQLIPVKKGRKILYTYEAVEKFRATDSEGKKRLN